MFCALILRASNTCTAMCTGGLKASTIDAMEVIVRRRSPHVALATAVAYPLVHPGWIRCAVLAGLLGAGGLGVAWRLASDPLQWQQWLLGIAWVLAGLAVTNLSLWRLGTFLHWNGSKWRICHGASSVADGEELVRCTVAMDAQRWLLLRATVLQPSTTRVRWVLIAQATNPGHWPDIRRVLYSSIVADQQSAPVA